MGHDGDEEGLDITFTLEAPFLNFFRQSSGNFLP